jgi:hypothetical protein
VAAAGEFAGIDAAMTEPFKPSFQWRPVESSKGTGYLFPDRFTDYMRDTYARPAVYRWRVFPALPNRNEEAYIGEAEILVKRAYAVRSARNASGVEAKTNYRLRKYFDKQLETHRHIALEWLDFPPFEIDSVRFEPLELWDPFRRKCVENLVLAISSQQQFEILNAHTDPISKTLRKFLGLNISGKRFRETVEQIRLARAPITTQAEARRIVVRAKL